MQLNAFNFTTVVKEKNNPWLKLNRSKTELSSKVLTYIFRTSFSKTIGQKSYLSAVSLALTCIIVICVPGNFCTDKCYALLGM